MEKQKINCIDYELMCQVDPTTPERYEPMTPEENIAHCARVVAKVWETEDDLLRAFSEGLKLAANTIELDNH